MPFGDKKRSCLAFAIALQNERITGAEARNGLHEHYLTCNCDCIVCKHLNEEWEKVVEGRTLHVVGKGNGHGT